LAAERNPQLATSTPRYSIVHHSNGGRHNPELLATRKGWLLEKMENEK